MDKKTKQLLYVGLALAVLYYFKNRSTKNNYSGNGEVDNQSDYSSDPGGTGYGAGVVTGDGGGGSGYVPSGDDDTTSIANDPSTSYTGTVYNVGKRPLNRPPVVGDKTSGMSGKPVVGAPAVKNVLPLGGQKMSAPSGGRSYFKR